MVWGDSRERSGWARQPNGPNRILILTSTIPCKGSPSELLSLSLPLATEKPAVCICTITGNLSEACLAGLRTFRVKTIFTLVHLAWYEAHAFSRVQRLGSHCAENGTFADSRPGSHRLRRLPAQVSHRRRGERYASIYVYRFIRLAKNST